MTQNNYTTKRKKFNHLNPEKRELIEKWLDEKYTKTQIAKFLGISRSTLYNEIKRGTVVQRRSDLTEYEKYHADVGQRVYEENRKRCKKPFKYAEAAEFTNEVEKEIIENKLSPDTACGKVKKEEKHKITVCTKTIYNYIDMGLLKIKNIDLLLKVRRNTKKKRPRKNKRIFGESIENRPQEINERTEFGHWEIDTIIGKRNTESVLLSLDERKTRMRFIVKIRNKTKEAVKEGLEKIMLGFENNTNRIFKSITSDNGSEFSDLSEILPNTKIYYAHPYSSYERGTNEKQNSLVRRFCKKGTNFDNIDEEVIKHIENWINELPRKAFGYATSAELFAAELKALENAV